ncbi:hypothetical protein ATK36_2030 [Amycolatopsis sulphurea]|uniref:DUF1508 domain-containing protein n=1 Tax=Amycolatopsis sulphurea TaxID=76022 RepID=A0A2A9F933_9PSEU|nr:hypothetical protein [Amycolatopsis sulphurea]PFG47020.1 hypothetical protein ATK36_2030 [Amycolatopsis sulphurea]
MAAARFQIFRAESDRVLWRFLSANNRSIARSAEDFPDPGACMVSLKELIRVVDTASILTVRTGQGLWRWQLRAGSADLAVSGRQYQRRIRASDAGSAFQDLAGKVQDVADLRAVSFDRTGT